MLLGNVNNSTFTIFLRFILRKFNLNNSTWFARFAFFTEVESTFEFMSEAVKDPEISIGLNAGEMVEFRTVLDNAHL